MDFFDLVNISERNMELVNPTSDGKILTIGRFLKLSEASSIIDFGCGYGEVLALWAMQYGITGTGIELRQNACERARTKMVDMELSDRVEIICGDAKKYEFKQHSYDVAACIGASFIWGGFIGSIRAMKTAIFRDGKLVIGEPYWLRDRVPPEYAATQQDIYTEIELLDMVQEEGFDVEYAVRANSDDWDVYEASNWYALIQWIEENPDHPERQKVIDHLHQIQEDYFQYGREYLGWAIYILNPARYM